MKPRDAMEQMLIMQAIWTHARLARLSLIANQQSGRENLQTVNDAWNRAANTFRRQMQALADYRNPRKGGDTFMAIKQANLAQQQVVQNGANGKLSETKSSNEQGSTEDAPKALSAHAVGTGVPTAVRPAGEAVGAIHRAENGGR